jgi:chromosome segregation ATPase
MWHWFTGIFSGAAENLQANPNVMKATYDAAIAKQGARFEIVQKAVAEQTVLREKRVVEIKNLNDKHEKLTKIMAGAAAMAKKLTEQLKAQGKSPEEIKTNADFMKHMAAYQDAASSLADCEKQIAEKESDMQERSKQIASFKIELQNMQRNAQKLQEEKVDAVAETQIAQQQESLKRTLAGITKDTTDDDLAAARAARDRAKASAKVISELTGNDANVAESEYLKYASDTTHADAFAALVGLDEGKPAVAEAPKPELEAAKLPEA